MAGPIRHRYAVREEESESPRFRSRVRRVLMTLVAGAAALVAFALVSGCSETERVNCQPDYLLGGTKCERTRTTQSDVWDWIKDNPMVGVAIVGSAVWAVAGLVKLGLSSGTTQHAGATTVAVTSIRPGDVLRGSDGSPLAVTGAAIQSDGSTILTYETGQTQHCPRDMTVFRVDNAAAR